SLVTKGGTNRFHGSAYEYHRPTMTVANDWFNKQAQLRAGESNRPPKVIRNTFGGSLGGPIIKDRVLFLPELRGTAHAGKRADHAHCTEHGHAAGRDSVPELRQGTAYELR